MFCRRTLRAKIHHSTGTGSPSYIIKQCSPWLDESLRNILAFSTLLQLYFIRPAKAHTSTIPYIPICNASLLIILIKSFDTISSPLLHARRSRWDSFCSFRAPPYSSWEAPLVLPSISNCLSPQFNCEPL